MVVDENKKINFENQEAHSNETSSVGNVEVAAERGVGQIPEMVDEAAVRSRIEKQEALQAASSTTATTTPAPPPKDEVFRSDSFKIIEGILDEDLGYIYEDLPPYIQKSFKEKELATAGEIEMLLQKAKVNFRKIVKLIVGWLRIIPGINKFYLEQEAKIKADKILLELHKK